MIKKTIGVGVIGLGTVGQGVAHILQTQGRRIEEKTGLRLELRKVAVRSLSKKRDIFVPKRLLTTHPMEVIKDPRVDIVAELVGGIEPAAAWIRTALMLGKPVVTANKALLAEKPERVYDVAEKKHIPIGIEASVCGGIPILRSIQEGFASNQIAHFYGIVNGTCNTILTSMSQTGMTFSAALELAKKQGIAEADPSLDIDGFDSAHKLAVLARLAFRMQIPYKKIFIQGIRGITAEDISYARELGYAIKLLAIGKNLPGGLELRVHPTLLPLDHPLAGVRGVYNAVFLHADQAGDLLFYGRGAGRMPTASAVLSDLLELAKELSVGQFRSVQSLAARHRGRVLPMDRLVSKYYLRFQVADKPGVLGNIAKILGRHSISILSVHQKESKETKSVPVVILTYGAFEENVRRAIRLIDKRKDVREKTQLIRVEA